jgi:hypothetical protein
MANVKDSLQQRYGWTLKQLQQGTFIQAMVSAILESKESYFRIHDSGDFFSVEYVNSWRAIAQALPHVRFWAPTRSHLIGGPMLDALRALAALPNVSVRPSAASFEGDVPEVAGLSAGTSASARMHTCRKPEQENKCMDCRICWDKTTAVVYAKH